MAEVGTRGARGGFYLLKWRNVLCSSKHAWIVEWYVPAGTVNIEVFGNGKVGVAIFFPILIFSWER